MHSNFDGERVNRSLQHVVRGLYFHETGEKWFRPIRVHSPAMLFLNVRNAAFANQMTAGMVAAARLYFNDVAEKGDNPEVFWYQLCTLPQEERLIARLCFYQGVEVLALSDPRLGE